MAKSASKAAYQHGAKDERRRIRKEFVKMLVSEGDPDWDEVRLFGSMFRCDAKELWQDVADGIAAWEVYAA